MPTKIKWPDGKIETVEDHLALLWKRQGRAEIIDDPATLETGPVATKEVHEAPVDKAVHKPAKSKSITSKDFEG